MKVAARIDRERVVRSGDPVPMQRIAEVLALYDEEKLWDTSSYVDRTRPGKASKYSDLPFVIQALQVLSRRLAYIESVVGPAEFDRWVGNAERRAAEIEGEKPTEQGEAS